MVAQIFCLTSSGGLPLLVRKIGDAEPVGLLSLPSREIKFSTSFKNYLYFQLSFSYIASLNGVHMFAKSQDVQLQDTISNEYVICWKEFHNR